MVAAALDRVGHELDDGHVRVRALRRGHPHRDRTAGHRARRRRRARSSTPVGAGTTRSRPRCACWLRREGRDAVRSCTSCRRCCSRARPRPTTCTCRATPTCSGRSRCCSRTTSSRTSGRSPAMSTAGATRSARADVSPLGAGALAGSSLPLDPDGVAERAGVRAPVRQLARCRLRPRLRRRGAVRRHAGPGAPLATRRGDRAVVERGVRVPAPRRRLQHRFVDAARRRRTPTSPSSPAARPAASSVTSRASSPRLKGLPLAYNRDLQEDKEPLFDALDQHRLALRRDRPGCSRRASRRRARMQRGRRQPASSAAVDLAEWLVEQGVPFREAHARVGAMVRSAAERGVPPRRAGAHRPGPRPRRARPCWSPARRCCGAPRPAAPGPASVAAQLDAARVRLDDQAALADSGSSPSPVTDAPRGRSTNVHAAIVELAPALLHKLLVSPRPDGRAR